MAPNAKKAQGLPRVELGRIDAIVGHVKEALGQLEPLIREAQTDAQKLALVSVKADLAMIRGYALMMKNNIERPEEV